MERYAITVEGIVQGVGFRPFVYRVARRLKLSGFVRNESGTVRIEAEGAREALARLLDDLVARPPPRALVERLAWEPQEPRGEREFRIDSSAAGDATHPVFIAPDTATCPDCLAELFDPRDRRFGYPFLNCTHCGPRLTIITGAPYDRPQTTMAAFPLCRSCRKEYDAPEDRRFHAEPIACAACGPRLALFDAAGEAGPADDPLGRFVAELRRGRVGALKGLGGYHLVCRAQDAAAVAELRRRKARDEKPLAVMVADAEAADVLCEIDEPERRLLASPAAPIVLLRRRPENGISERVAPGQPTLGIMLPYTPLHHLLMRGFDRAPLVMTSGNRSDEPIAYRDEDALSRLRGIADVFLTHNRPIHVRCDDSVTRVVNGAELPVRRSRGYAPQPIRIAAACPCPILAVGGQLKATFALGRDRDTFVSHHLGDLDHFEALRAFERDVALYEQLFALRPERIAHDLHPDYASTRYAIERAERTGIPLVPVQHHHAHMASCIAENRLPLDHPAIGVALDGTGYGTDGAVWGGEFLVGDCRRFRRAAHLRYVGMPGGEQAIREPWRMAVAHLRDAGIAPPRTMPPVADVSLRTIETMLARRLNSPNTSSMGRLFDAVAALAGVRTHTRHEGQAAVELESLATAVPADGEYPFDLQSSAADEGPQCIDTRPLVRAVVADLSKGTDAGRVARRFHSTVVELGARVCEALRAATGVETVVLSGGVFLNALLTGETVPRLEAAGFRVFRHRLVPPGDGGLSLGQLAVAVASAPETGALISDSDSSRYSEH